MSTNVTSGREPDPARAYRATPAALAVPKYTQSQIAEALISVATSILHTRLNRAQALVMADVLGTFINDPRNKNFEPGGNLDGNPAFNSLVAEKALLLAQAGNDPDAVQAAARAELERHNVSGAPLSAATLAALGMGRTLQAAGTAASSDGGSNGARFDSISAAGAKGNWNTPAGQAQMREFAVQHGVPWVAGHPELLRLGPAAIQTLAETHLRQETYRRLTKESGFAPKDVVGIARWAKEHHRDADEVGNAIADVNKGLTAEERRRHNAAVMGVVSPKPGEEETAKKHYDETMEGLGKVHPELKPKIENEQRLLDHRRQQAASAEHRADRKEAGATAQQAKTAAKQADAAAATDKTNSTLNALNGASSESSKSPSKSPQPKQAATHPH